MSDSKSGAAARSSPAGMVRLALSIGGVAFVVVNVVLMVAGEMAAGTIVPAALWAGAAVCFLGAFVAFMLEPNKKTSDPVKPADPAKDGGETAPPPAAAEAAKADAIPTGVADAPKAGEPAVDGKGGEAADGPPAPPLVRRGNPLRWLRGGVTAVVACLVGLLLMAHPGQLRWGVPIGAVFMVVASWGVMDFLGTFDDEDKRVVASHSLRSLASPALGFLASFVLFAITLGLAHDGRGLPQIGWGVVVTLAFIFAVVMLFRLGHTLGVWAEDEDGVDRPIWKRHGFWLVVLAAGLMFPFMGSYALWDPWETHYGEVSREILAKDDWISLWWAQDGWFWSKPVLDMWMQAITMATLGVHYQPDKMLVGDGMKPFFHPEWAVRAPVVLLTIVALYFLYKGVAKTFGRRPAFLGGLVLA
ncbi:MAG TPA: hypothetical protein VIF09_12035, partial [Polyangiaceae bacterium]